MKDIIHLAIPPRVFVCKVATQLHTVTNSDRQAEIDGCAHLDVKLEKYTAWQLLCHAFSKVYGVDFDILCPTKTPSGKWICQNYYFSLSHSKGLCAVVVDDMPVGLDVEMDSPRFDDRLAQRICHPNELAFLQSDNGGKISAPYQMHIGESLPLEQRQQRFANPTLAFWCKKEALFKTYDYDTFIPNKVDTTDYVFLQTQLNVDGKTYHLALSTPKRHAKVQFVEIE